MQETDSEGGLNTSSNPNKHEARPKPLEPWDPTCVLQLVASICQVPPFQIVPERQCKVSMTADRKHEPAIKVAAACIHRVCGSLF